MKSTVQARLTPEERKMLAELVRDLGWSSSQVVREGIRLLGASRSVTNRRRIVGLGKFDSGLKDLGSNPEHLRGFGH